MKWLHLCKAYRSPNNSPIDRGELDSLQDSMTLPVNPIAPPQRFPEESSENAKPKKPKKRREQKTPTRHSTELPGSAMGDTGDGTGRN